MNIFLRPQRWTDADMVRAVLQHDDKLLERIFRDCRTYFCRHAGAFFIAQANIDDIFQEAIIHLWREIETQRITLVDGRVCRLSNGVARPMTCSLTTYLMSVAQRKHWELQRRTRDMSMDAITDTSALEAQFSQRYGDALPEDVEEQTLREQIVSDAILAMSPRCREIITLFYYEQRTLDDILQQRQENASKTGLKTSKYKCMQRLRENVRQLFQRYRL